MYASDGKVGCTPCHEVNNLGVRASRGVNISTQWADGNVTFYGSTRTVQLSSLRKKICEHRNSKAHQDAINILETAKKDVLLNLNAQSEQSAFQSTALVFRTAYYVAKNSKPFTDFEKLINLQQANSIDMGRVLHSKTVAVDIIEHISSHMKKKTLTKIIESRSKINVLADESTRVGDKSTLIVFLRASINGKAAPITFPLDLVELESLCASHIADKIVDCLLKNGYSIELLQEVIIGFCSDGASVMLGTKSGVGKLLKDKFPDIILWHCLNHRLELAVGIALSVVQMTFSHFLNIYIRCTASHQRTSVNLTNVPMICKRPSKESARCLLFAGSLHPSGQYQQSGILSQLWRNILIKLQMTKRGKAQKRPDFEAYCPNFAQ